MNLLQPGWLGLLALGGIILLFHSLRPKRRPVEVPSLLLWQQVQKELVANASWRRLVSSLLLCVHLLVLALLALALAQPFVARERPSTLEAIVIDASASMGATDVAPSRFAAARQAAVQHMRASGGDVLIVLADANPQVLHLGAPDSQALALLDQATPFAGSADWSAVADLLQAAGDELQHIVVFTDGVIDPEAFAPVLAVAGNRLSIDTIGSHAPNVAITAFEARRLGSELDTYQLLVSVRNFGDSPTQVPLRVHGRAEAILNETLHLDPGEERRVLAPYRYTGSDVLQAELRIDDALASDNTAHLVVQPPPASRVALVGAGSRAFDRGLAIFPHVTLERRILLPSAEADRYDLVIFDRVPPPAGFTGLGVVVGRADGSQATVEQPIVTWWDRTHPLTRFVDWSQLRVTRATQLPSNARVLVDSNHGPLISLDTNAERTLVYLAFALEDSDFPTRVGFPIFLSHLLDFADPAGGQPVQEPALAGLPYALPRSVAIGFDSTTWRVTDPTGEPISVRIEADRATVVPRAAGLYTIIGPQYTAHFAVRPPGPLESSLKPRIGALRGEAAKPAGDALYATPVWRALLVLALLLLFAEAWLYLHRGRKPLGRTTPTGPRPLRRIEAVGRSRRGGARG